MFNRERPFTVDTQIKLRGDRIPLSRKQPLILLMCLFRLGVIKLQSARRMWKCVRHDGGVAHTVETNRWEQLGAVLRKRVAIRSTASAEITLGQNQ